MREDTLNINNPNSLINKWIHNDMQYTFSFLTGICLLLVTVACGAGKEKVSGSASAVGREQTQQEVMAEKPFDLMSLSALDTNSGVFYGDHNERITDKITVKVRLEVTLLEGRITDITLLDTVWVHPEAAQLIPRRIIEQQKLPVEAVSGASVSSWSIMSATAIALELNPTVLEGLASDDDMTDL